MEFSGIISGAEDHFAAGLQELKRGVAALATNTSRPHKQLVQRGSFVYTTGNVLHRAPITARHSTVLSEIEHAISLGSDVTTNASPYGRWQDNEPILERDLVEVNAKVFIRPTSATLAQDITEVVASVCAARNTSYIDTLIIAAPPASGSGIEYDALFDAWAVAESLVASGSVRALAVSGIDSADRLSALVSQAKIAPSAVYVDPKSSSSAKPVLGTIPAVYIDADSDVDVSLLTPTSTRARLSQAKREGQFGTSFHSALVPPFEQTSFTPLAAARYTVFIPSRSVVVAKGYAVKSKYMIA